MTRTFPGTVQSRFRKNYRKGAVARVMCHVTHKLIVIIIIMIIIIIDLYGAVRS